MLKQIGFYFLQGLLLVVPIAALVYIVFSMLVFIDNILPFDVPGVGLLIVLLGVTLLGFLATSIVATPIMNWGNKLLDKLPLLKTIFSALKDLMSAFVGNTKNFNQPVLVKMNKESDIEKPGFVTQNDLKLLGLNAGKVAVYLPHSFNFSGNLYVVPTENVSPVAMKSADFMKFIVSGGISTFDESES